MKRFRTALLRAFIDWHIGWHQGRAAAHLSREATWKQRYENRWPNPYRADESDPR